MPLNPSKIKAAFLRFRSEPGSENTEGWICTKSNPWIKRPMQNFRFYAVIGAWFEGDVIGATVKNALSQGCDQVFLIDNASPDNTVEEAVSAGAVLLKTFRTESYDEPQRIRIMNQCVKEISENDGNDHIWWLWLDADEFPHGPNGMTIRDYLRTLDKKFRIVGSRYFNHFPATPPHYKSGYHPIDFQPLCEEFIAKEFNSCVHGHWKHPLQRFDASGPWIESEPGFHRAVCDETLFEPATPIFNHHFPYRNEEFTRSRLDALCGASQQSFSRNELHDQRVGGVSGIRKRYKSLDMVYRQRWGEVENLHRAGPSIGVKPRSWQEICGDSCFIPRWYDTPLTENVITKRK